MQRYAEIVKWLEDLEEGKIAIFVGLLKNVVKIADRLVIMKS